MGHTHEETMWEFVFVAGVCETVTDQVLHTKRTPRSVNHTQRHGAVKDDQGELLPNKASSPPWQTHTHNQRRRPNPTGQHVRQRSENTFSTWLSNRAAWGSALVLVSAHPPCALLLHRRSTASSRWGQPDRDKSILCRLEDSIDVFLLFSVQCNKVFFVAVSQKKWLWQFIFTWTTLYCFYH